MPFYPIFPLDPFQRNHSQRLIDQEFCTILGQLKFSNVENFVGFPNLLNLAPLY